MGISTRNQLESIIIFNSVQSMVSYRVSANTASNLSLCSLIVILNITTTVHFITWHMLCHNKVQFCFFITSVALSYICRTQRPQLLLSSGHGDPGMWLWSQHLGLKAASMHSNILHLSRLGQNLQCFSLVLRVSASVVRLNASYTFLDLLAAGSYRRDDCDRHRDVQAMTNIIP